MNVLSWRIDNAVHGKHIFDSKKLRNSNFWILLHDYGIQSSFWSLKMANRPLKLLLLVAYLCPSLLSIGLIFEGLFKYFGTAQLMRSPFIYSICPASLSLSLLLFSPLAPLLLAIIFFLIFLQSKAVTLPPRIESSKNSYIWNLPIERK